jgi:hypothetical protein
MFFGTPAVWKWRYGNGGMEMAVWK